MNKLLQQLSESFGPAGAEKEVRILIKNLIEPLVDRWEVDSMGNLIACKKGTGESSLRVMVDAHMDEVGMMVTEIDAHGYLKFITVGGIDNRALLGKLVQVGPKKITGVIGARPIHLLNSGQRNSVVSSDSMRIDIGASGKESAKQKVSLGDKATFLTEYKEFGNTVMGKALDNRLGCAALIQLLEKDRYPFDLYATFTVQEEIGCVGAEIASRSVQPDIALILESTPAYDLPTKADTSPNVALGKGPSVYVMDRRTIQDPRFVSFISRTATENNIPFQHRKPGGGGTNTSSIQRSSIGVPAATIATPTRYIHTPISLANMVDFGNVVQLSDTVLRNLTDDLFNRN